MCAIMHDEVTDSWFLVMPEVIEEKLQTKLTKSSGKGLPEFQWHEFCLVWVLPGMCFGVELDEFFMDEWMMKHVEDL